MRRWRRNKRTDYDKKVTELYTQPTKATMTGKKSDTIFRRVRSFFSRRRRSTVDPFPLKVLLEVLPQRLSLSALEAMTDLVALLQRAGLRIEVEVLREEIPDGYIGRMSAWNGGSGVFLKCWLLPRGYFDKNQPGSLQTN